jgi:putative transcription antitermination factor YqgF
VDAAALAALVDRHGIDEVIVGLPLEASGVEGEQVRRTRAWTDAVGTTLGRPMSYRDERLTSHLAEQRLGPMPRGRSGGPPTAHQRNAYRARVDREAAAIILQDELDARSAAASRAATGSTS